MKIFGLCNTKQNEVSVFKSKGFLNKFRMVTPRILVAVILCGLLAVSCSTPGGKKTAWTNKSNERSGNIKKVAVFIDLEKPSGNHPGINRDQIQNDIEMKLRQAGIDIVSQPKTSFSSGPPIIYVNVTIGKWEAIYAYNVDLVYMNPSSKQTKIGKGSTIGTSGLVPELTQVRLKVLDLVNRFIKDFLLV